ncbi:hypothetical protein [Meiothermus taiwanensis]|uniref:Uncharacterized protein n=1 Tax=Meiothermus taiwanensis TaxID=172827 RepID=A0A399E0V1_9DEIN|nr:hypothetical protein [Meiothermus taiwanensis]RIH77169.1 hypothetical protein Mcate_01422 [Meiothermus taiwanensis]
MKKRLGLITLIALLLALAACGGGGSGGNNGIWDSSKWDQATWQ